MYPKTLSILIIIFITAITQTHSLLDHKFVGCAPQSCGNLSSIRYPFWIPNKQEPYCGHPSLKITCENDEIPILQISIDKYIITHIDYPNHKFHLANSILFNDTISCPTPLYNITLNQTLLNFSNDYVEFFLFYNCSSLPKDFNVIFPISCGENDSKFNNNKSFGDFHGEVLAKFNYSIALCQSVVVAPVDVGEGQGQGLSLGSSTSSLWNTSYEKILSQGFTLNWTTPDCGGCERSGGRCGFDGGGGDKFVCFCRDKPHSQSCHHGKEAPKIKIIIGAGVAASGSILVACLACFLYTQRHKWKINSDGSKNPGYTARKNTSYSSAESESINGSTYFGVQLFSYRELELATHFFDPSNELGDGGFGTVYYAKLGDGREVAIKRLYENNNKRAQQFMNEVEILAHLRHNNLVTLYGCTSRQSRDLLLVYEYVPNGTVADHLHGQKAKPGSLPWPTRLTIAIETASALLYLHASDIIHRDVKTQNILLDKDFSVKVADFGLSRLFPLDVTHVSTAPQGTPGYVDPEYYQCYQLTEKSDVYSFGVMLAELLSSMPAVDITRKRQDINLSNMAIDKIQNNALHELVDLSLGFESDFRVKREITAVAELAFRCLQGTREMRPSMEEVLETLREVEGHAKKVDMADVVDIPYDDMNMLKSDLSPGSTQMDENSTRAYKLHTSA